MRSEREACADAVREEIDRRTAFVRVLEQTSADYGTRYTPQHTGRFRKVRSAHPHPGRCLNQILKGIERQEVWAALQEVTDESFKAQVGLQQHGRPLVLRLLFKRMGFPLTQRDKARRGVSLERSGAEGPRSSNPCLRLTAAYLDLSWTGSGEPVEAGKKRRKPTFH